MTSTGWLLRQIIKQIAGETDPSQSPSRSLPSAFRHRGGLGKNRRSYRRGYGRRFRFFLEIGVPHVSPNLRDVGFPLFLCALCGGRRFLGPRNCIPPQLLQFLFAFFCSPQRHEMSFLWI